MNYKHFNFGLPIKDNNVKIISGIVQYDTANIVTVRLMDGTEPFDFTGYTDLMISILKPDGHTVMFGITSDGENDNNPYNLQVIEPTEGKIKFTLHSQATIATGTHFGTISLFDAGRILTSARFNYYVGESLSNEFDPSIESDDDYNFLLNLINRNSSIADAEKNRVEAEGDRIRAEEERQETFNELYQHIEEYLGNATEYVAKTEAFMNEAKRFAEFAQNPSKEAVAKIISELDLAGKEYVDSEIDDATRDFIVGDINNENRKKLTVGLTEQDITSLEDGELGVEKENIFAGINGKKVLLNGVYVVSSTAPEETSLLWIDTSAKNQLKFYDNSSWQPVSMIAFA